jgi:four helix bundle protein
MKYERFEDLPVWGVAIGLAREIYRITRNRFFAQPGDLRDQLRRSALSVSNNIAEGFERGSTAELIAFLYIARGSAGEVRSMLRFIESAPEAGQLQSEIAALIATAESCSRQIRAWADHLQNTDIKGQRHLDDRARRLYKSKRDAAEFKRYLEEITQRGRIQQQGKANAEPGSQI